MSVRSTPYVLRSNDKAFKPILIRMDEVPDFWITTRVDFIQMLHCQLEKKRAEFKHERLVFFAEQAFFIEHGGSPDQARWFMESFMLVNHYYETEFQWLEEKINNA
jgi:hypothetical protein